MNLQEHATLLKNIEKCPRKILQLDINGTHHLTMQKMYTNRFGPRFIINTYIDRFVLPPIWLFSNWNINKHIVLINFFNC